MPKLHAMRLKRKHRIDRQTDPQTKEVTYWENKANRPTTRPQRFALCDLHYAMVVAAEAALAEVAALVVAAVVVLLVVEESHGMIFCLKKFGFFIY